MYGVPVEKKRLVQFRYYTSRTRTVLFPSILDPKVIRIFAGQNCPVDIVKIILVYILLGLKNYIHDRFNRTTSLRYVCSTNVIRLLRLWTEHISKTGPLLAGKIEIRTFF